MRAANISLFSIMLMLWGQQMSHVPAADDLPSVIEPHAETQQLMTELLRPPPMTDEAEQRRKLETLIKLAKVDGPRFVRQVVLHKVRNDPENRVAFADLGSMLFLKEASLPEGHYAEGLSILLYCDNEPIRKYARKLFSMALGRRCVNGHADLSHIRDFVTGDYQKEELATPLKRAIFEGDPHAAFDLYLQSETQRIELSDAFKLGRAERAIRIAKLEREMTSAERSYLALAKKRGLPDENAEPPPPWQLDARTRGAIRELATSKHWWARMFVAEIMVQNKDFRDAELLKKLAEDENELVRQSVASIDKPDPLRVGKVDR